MLSVIYVLSIPTVHTGLHADVLQYVRSCTGMRGVDAAKADRLAMGPH